jgi:SAM-dependent methyltransferase
VIDGAVGRLPGVADVDIDAIKAHHRELWGMGDYSVLSRQLAPAARALCDACAVSAGQEVLDVAAGDGNFAIACAAEGASVVASDISPGQVERGRARTDREGYDVEWVEADAEALPFEDARFDCVGSVFGAMIAPRPEVVARELFRVVRPGNTVGLTAWTRDSFCTRMFEVARRYVPPQPVPQSEEWGDEDVVRERLNGLAGTLDMERQTLVWEAPSPDAWIAEMRDTAPAMVAARAALPADRFEAMVAETADLLRAEAGDGPLRIEAEYLVTVARKRG